MKRSIRILNYIFSGLAITYGVLLLFPQILFSNVVKHKNFKVYYHSEEFDTNQLTSILDESINLLNSSDVFDSEKEQKIFLCASFEEFTFFAPRSRKSFAVNYPLTQNIFLSKSSIPEDKIQRNGNENNTRTLSGVIAHETTHSALENHLGIFRYKLLPSWKNEGYCDYVSKESSYDAKLGWTKICNNEAEDSPSYDYFKYKTYVEYLLKEEKIPFDIFLVKDFNTDSVAFRSKKVLCPK